MVAAAKSVEALVVVSGGPTRPTAVVAVCVCISDVVVIRSLAVAADIVPVAPEDVTSVVDTGTVHVDRE